MKKYRAYSLLELSIVLFIMAILLTSGGLLFSNISRNQNIKEAQIVTLERTDKIYKAILNYLAENRHLPCPATLDTKSNDLNYGSSEDCNADLEQLTGGTNNLGIGDNMKLIYGMVPIDILNLSKQDAEDGYGHKFGYAIIKEFGTKTRGNFGSDSYIPGFESYSGTQRLGEDKDEDFEYIKIMDSSTGEDIITNKAIMILISHGENRSGAYNPDTGSQTNTNNYTPNEYDNFFTNDYDNIFFIDSNETETDSGTSQIVVFDDLVIFKTKDQLVRDAGLEFIKCSAEEGFVHQDHNSQCFASTEDGNISEKSYGETGDITVGDEILASDCGCTENTTFILQRTCGKYGKWSDIFCNENHKLDILDEVRADGEDGLKLFDDGGNGIFIEDGGKVGINTGSASLISSLEIHGGDNLTTARFKPNKSGAHHESVIHWGDDADWYIRSGNSNGKVIIQDMENSRVGIGTQTPISGYKLHVEGNTNITGNLTVGGTINGTLFPSDSDRRYKNNIKSLKNILPKIMKLNAIYYDWKREEFPDKNFSKKRQIGFIAQEIEKLFPELVHNDNSNYKSITYSKITAILVRAIQELQEEQKAEIQKIKENYNQKIEKLIKRIEKLEDDK